MTMPFTVTRVKNWKQCLGKILEGQQRASIMVFLKKAKPTQRYAQPRWPIIRLAFPMSGDEYFAEPTRQKIESSTDATLLDRLLQDAMVAFCYCCSHNIDVRFKWEKKIIIIILLLWIIVKSKGRQSLAFRIQFDTNIYIFIGSRVGWAMRIDKDQTSVFKNHLKAEFLSYKVSVKY